MSSVPPIQPPMTQPAAVPPQGKKKSPWVWVAVGCGGLMVVTVVVLLVITLIVGKKVKQYADEYKKNPAVAAVKLATSFNPDLEVESVDNDAGVITVRNKKTGETFTVDMAEAKQGKIRFRDDKGQEVSITASGKGKDGGSLKVESDKGKFVVGQGAAAEAPDWVPAYPETTVTGSMVNSDKSGTGGGFTFETKDDPAGVLDFYQKAFEKAGFKVETHTYDRDRRAQGGMLSATDEATERSCTVTVTPSGTGSTAVVVYSTKS